MCIPSCLVMFYVDAMEASYEPVSSQCGTGLRAKASITGSKLASTESNFISEPVCCILAKTWLQASILASVLKPVFVPGLYWLTTMLVLTFCDRQVTGLGKAWTRLELGFILAFFEEEQQTEQWNPKQKFCFPYVMSMFAEISRNFTLSFIVRHTPCTFCIGCHYFYLNNNS